MSQKRSPETISLLADLRRLRAAARALLDFASPDAREEWNKLERRLGDDDTRPVTLSEAELTEVHSKVCRFRDILAALAVRRRDSS